MSKSLRSRLLVRIALTTFVVLGVTAATAFVLVRSSLLKEFDSLLGSMAEAMTKLIELEQGRVKIEFTEHRLQAFVRKVRPEYYEVWNADGVVIARSPYLGENDLISDPNIPDDTYSFIQLPDGRRGRVVAERFFPLRDEGSTGPSAESSRQMTLAVACGTEEIDGAVIQLGWMIFVASVGALVILIAALAWTVTHALRPLEALASQIGDVSERSLSTRFDLSGAPKEILPVVERTNSLMERLEQAFIHERTLTADVAHELRTPLAGIRSTLQVALSRTRSPSEYCESLDEIDRICGNVQRLVESLLSLAQLEADTVRADGAEWEYVDIKVLVENVWTKFEEQSRKRQLHVTRDGPSDFFLRTDAAKMRVVLGNLFDNAVAYCNEGGTVHIEWHLSDSNLIISVSNSGCQVDFEQMQHVFDRFWRGDPARADSETHSGLGLALCRKVVDSVDGFISAERRGDIFQVELVFSRDRIEIADEPIIAENAVS